MMMTVSVMHVFENGHDCHKNHVVLMLVEIGTCTVAFVTSQIALNQYMILTSKIFLRLCNMMF